MYACGSAHNMCLYVWMTVETEPGNVLYKITNRVSENGTEDRTTGNFV